MSEGLPPFLSMLSQNDAETEAAGNMFEVIEEESWRGENKLYGPHGPPGNYCDCHDFYHKSYNYQELEKMDRKKLHENAKKFFLVMRE